MNQQTTKQEAGTAVKRERKEDTTSILAGILGTSPSLNTVPFGFVPLGSEVTIEGINPGDIPQTLSDLGELLSYTYDLTVRRAGELNIPVIGSISGGMNRRVIILEWTRYKELLDEAVTLRYGFVIRFCLTVSKWDAQAKLTLPFLSAQAELGNIQASWMMQVRGLTGSKIDAAVLPPQELDVKTFIIAKQSLEAVIAAVNDPSTRFVPGILTSKIDPTSEEAIYWLSAVKAFAMSSIRRGRTAIIAQGKLASLDPAANDAITEVYNYFGIPDPNQTPSNEARQNASRVLGGINSDV